MGGGDVGRSVEKSSQEAAVNNSQHRGEAGQLGMAMALRTLAGTVLGATL